MVGETPPSTIANVRALTSGIDRSLETLLESHGFSFAALNAADALAEAFYRRQDESPFATWQLSLTRSNEGRTWVVLRNAGPDESSPTLSIPVGGDLAGTLTAAVGLAVSFVAAADQIKTMSQR